VHVTSAASSVWARERITMVIMVSNNAVNTRAGSCPMYATYLAVTRDWVIWIIYCVDVKVWCVQLEILECKALPCQFSSQSQRAGRGIEAESGRPSPAGKPSLGVDKLTAGDVEETGRQARDETEGTQWSSPIDGVSST
jgi:hypothetical protein